MIREQVADGVSVVCYEAGIGGEGYDPPRPRRQEPRTVAEFAGGIVIDPETEWRHGEWVKNEGWKISDQASNSDFV